MFKEVLAATVIGVMGVTASGAQPVPAAVQHNAAESADHKPDKNYRYSDDDIVSFFILHAGPVFDLRPDLALRLGYVRNTPSAETVTTVMSLFRQVDPKLHQRVTTAVQSGDPVRAEAGLKALTDDFEQVMANMRKTQSLAGGISPMSYNNGPVSNFVDTITFVAVAAVVLGAVAVLAGAVLVIFYAPQDGGTAYDRQLNSLAVSKSLS
ncbi:hypothetical protein ACIPYU_06890 [Paenarthrobacter nicotinovorans]|jgi:SdpC family antimicrobial peptide|uniref:hypothetical protein n=1 Tax=Paenarthrobacter nicotinovorans TaxID=29320 RepID=UPI0037FCF59A